MSEKTALLALDQGTTSSRAIVFDLQGNSLSVGQQEFPQIYPDDGWVEHDPEAIWQSMRDSMADALSGTNADVKAIGITNQRETTLIWDRETGEPIHNAIVWQDRRTADICRDLHAQGLEEEVRQRSGLLLDPYFSATKAAWILDHVEGARAKAERGELAFGTVDSFLIWRLTGGAVHATDATNACRTNLYNIRTGSWDPALCEIFNVPMAMLPKVQDCASDFGTVAKGLPGAGLPILGVAGDQQAATIGQACFAPGDIKSTYGTGCFVVMNTGDEMILSDNRLLSTIAYQLGGKATYALEGSIFIAGAAVQWLRDELGVIETAAQTEELMAGLKGHGGVFLVPAFAGLGAPHWDPDARAALFGMTRGSGPAELAQAAVESAAYQTSDLLAAAQGDGVNPAALKVDGGMVANSALCQLLADVLEVPVDRPMVMETTALGAAYLAGLQAGLYGSLDEIASQWQLQQRFEASMSDTDRQKRLDGWHRAVRAVLTFNDPLD